MSIDLAWLGQKFPDLSPIAPLGTGGQKTVFSAQHPTDGDVVLKIIHPQHDPETANREMLAVKAVQSPRVPRILDNGTITTTLGNSIWIREQRVSGTPLSERLQSGPIDPTRLLKLGLHMLEALVSAEQVHIVHRDVKPDNIMCDTNDNFWLLDFGVARHLRLQSLTATSSPFGKFTPGYAPPEQFRNIKHDIDARADLFALGVTLYQSATGKNPFQEGARDFIEVLRRVEKMNPPPLALTFGSANEFRDLVSTMMQKRLDHRLKTANDALNWMRDICIKENIA
jgi:serine/threonine protein kinase